jgi:hypothetical protein
MLASARTITALIRLGLGVPVIVSGFACTAVSTPGAAPIQRAAAASHEARATATRPPHAAGQIPAEVPFVLRFEDRVLSGCSKTTILSRVSGHVTLEVERAGGVRLVAEVVPGPPGRR